MAEGDGRRGRALVQQRAGQSGEGDCQHRHRRDGQQQDKCGNGDG